MRIVTVRRISQVFFVSLFLWFCLVTTLGTAWWQLRGWPVNWLMQLDPLVALSTLLSTRTLYRGLLWALLTVVLTLAFGRVFCGWLCPLGTLQQAVGYLAQRRRKRSERLRLNGYHPAQNLKYLVLAAVLGMSAWGLVGGPASLQNGLLDPLPLLHRTVNVVLLPLVALLHPGGPLADRGYEGAWLIGLMGVAILGLAARVPRFYCRFICPLGALLGLLSRWSIWHIGKSASTCSACQRCGKDCEGACSPDDKIRVPECLMCMNCFHTCGEDVLGFRAVPSAAGEYRSPEVSRRGFLMALGTGAVSIPAVRLNRALGANGNPHLLRPPGALAEADFLARCIKCGQCMKVCPTNIIQPAWGQGGWEGLWSPVLNYRIGSSGCELNCVACGQVCPTAALRPLDVSEKRGLGEHAGAGPVRMGLAFVDRSRCLPWAFDRPCIVCQEVCPVSPKAIQVKEQKPHVDAERCIGCGVCEHECPVSGLRAIRVTAENESRHPGRVMTL